MREGLKFGKPYFFQNTTLSSASPFLQSQSLLSQSFGQLLSPAGELPNQQKSVNAGKNLSKKLRSNSQGPDQAKRDKEVNSQTMSLCTHDVSLLNNRTFYCLVSSPASYAVRDFWSIARPSATQSRRTDLYI